MQGGFKRVLYPLNGGAVAAKARKVTTHK